MSAGAPAWKVWAVWLCRIVAGATFTVSGWAKAVDPRGFTFKIDEYLTVWGMADVLPDGMTGIIGCAISIFELCIGILLLTGSLRRSAPICGLLMMAVWLPLTAYIAVANPVADCGCFGDFIVLSNTATFIKNLILTAVLVICIIWHKAAQPLFRPGLQWLIPTLTALYGIVVATIGWQFQPMVDFRPYPVGSTLTDSSEESHIIYIYSKDGREEEFPLEALPDTTWTFEGIKEPVKGEAKGLAVFDGDDEVTEELFGTDAPSEMIVLVYAEPGLDDLLRSRMANEIYEFAREHGIEMIGLVAASGDALDQWKELARPDYDVFSADDTSLKQLVRGPIGIVFMRDGHVVWKRNFSTLPADILMRDNPMGSVRVFDDGRVAVWLSGFFVVGLLLLLGISKLTTIRIRPPRMKRQEKATGAGTSD